uniref:Y+L amino acid transporter 2 n=1 Tax=Timema bartmani TaxID=61472 RepID=A0A7R9ERQ4_9NEOP|nr:unnamed protein product [Timema bartmani]
MDDIATPMSEAPMLNSPGNDKAFQEWKDEEKVRMKKQLGLLEGVAIILGIIFGSAFDFEQLSFLCPGIFVSPKGVIMEVKSVGLSLVIWMLCGLLSMIGALCYAELGTSIPKSGGDYAYIFEAFGPLPAFLYLWDAMLIFVPTTNAIMGLTFANYVIQPFFPNCSNPDSAVRLIAAVTICFLTFMNCYDIKQTTKMQNVFMFTKILALVLIIIAGLSYLLMGNTSNFENAFEGGSTDPGKIAVAFYSGIFSYSGWNYLNFMTEELKNPYVYVFEFFFIVRIDVPYFKIIFCFRNLPRAIYISLPLVTLIYVFANVAYLAVLTPMAMEASNAIAVTFADRVLGMMSWSMPLLVALSAFGGLSVHIMTSSRMCFVGARYGHFPAMLSHINVDRFTPTPSLVFLNILSLIMLCTSDVYVLITYSSFVESFFIMLSVGGMLWLRYKRPNMTRPIKSFHEIIEEARMRWCRRWACNEDGEGENTKGIVGDEVCGENIKKEMGGAVNNKRASEEEKNGSRVDDLQICLVQISNLLGDPLQWACSVNVSLWVPIVFIVVCMFLVFVPCYYVPYEVGMGVLITVTGIPAFFLGVVWEKKPSWFIHALVAPKLCSADRKGSVNSAQGIRGLISTMGPWIFYTAKRHPRAKKFGNH